MILFNEWKLSMDKTNDDGITKVDEYDEDDILFQVSNVI